MRDASCCALVAEPPRAISAANRAEARPCRTPWPRSRRPSEHRRMLPTLNRSIRQEIDQQIAGEAIAIIGDAVMALFVVTRGKRAAQRLRRPDQLRTSNALSGRVIAGREATLAAAPEGPVASPPPKP